MLTAAAVEDREKKNGEITARPFFILVEKKKNRKKSISVLYGRYNREEYTYNYMSYTYIFTYYIVAHIILLHTALYVQCI